MLLPVGRPSYLETRLIAHPAAGVAFRAHTLYSTALAVHKKSIIKNGIPRALQDQVCSPERWEFGLGRWLPGAWRLSLALLGAVGGVCLWRTLIPPVAVVSSAFGYLI